MESFTGASTIHTTLPRPYWATFAEMLPTLGYLSLITVIVLAFSLWRFSRGKIFD